MAKWKNKNKGVIVIKNLDPKDEPHLSQLVWSEIRDLSNNASNIKIKIEVSSK